MARLGVMGVACSLLTPSASRASQAADQAGKHSVPEGSADSGGPKRPRALDEAPQEPNDREFLPAPRGQLERWNALDGKVAPRHDTRRRVQVTLAPAYATLNFETLPWGRRLHGYGVGGEIDLRLVRGLWLRTLATYSTHPVRALLQVDEAEESVEVLAPGGQLRTYGAGAAFAYALDIGRVMPVVELGVGGLWMQSPAHATPGALGGQCREVEPESDQFPCDTDLRCSAGGQCEQQPKLEVIAGIGVDVAVLHYMSWGLHVRYYISTDPASGFQFPTHLSLSLRASLRF